MAAKNFKKAYVKERFDTIPKLLTKPDSSLQPLLIQSGPNRRKMLQESGFLATDGFMLHVKSRA
jgi:hypothetical protein